jgi:hypothetical protein
MRPTPKNLAQMAKFRPIWSHCSVGRFLANLAGAAFFVQNIKLQNSNCSLENVEITNFPTLPYLTLPNPT